jgi:hypothetical protein
VCGTPAAVPLAPLVVLPHRARPCFLRGLGTAHAREEHCMAYCITRVTGLGQNVQPLSVRTQGDIAETAPSHVHADANWHMPMMSDTGGRNARALPSARTKHVGGGGSGGRAGEHRGWCIVPSCRMYPAVNSTPVRPSAGVSASQVTQWPWPRQHIYQRRTYERTTSSG